MEVAENFRTELALALDLLAEDEWAITKARERTIDKIEQPHIAFESIVPVLNLAIEQQDEYAFMSCCWLALQLAQKANTTEFPINLSEILKSLTLFSARFSPAALNEVNAVEKWFRINI
ncbi:TPA: hypothetical protein P2I01_001300 [Aeromonas salmonicida]|uniref:hypothetical protein n=1 Tax=Aeromonas salmonicida TaxID=645 RepID=UPI00259E5307|nr:hypothetical protein [Aeromonas salmonicida]MDM5150563.1 hypothetical protein [Aeromonas salmonicida]HDN9014471.1 hypothetical protein [Aeromonas salmonicida]